MKFEFDSLSQSAKREIVAEAKKHGRSVVVMTNRAGNIGLALVDDLERGVDQVLELPREAAEALLVDLQVALEVRLNLSISTTVK